MRKIRTPQTLFVDADDTLWENNVFFEEIVRAFCDMMAARGRTHEEARETLNVIERRRTRINGYGIRNFRMSLHDATRTLLAGRPAPEELHRIDQLCALLPNQTLPLLAGVRETLRELSGRHRIVLLTKGDLDDQLDKVQRSGLRRFLHRVDVVREKDVDAYRDALARHGARADLSWMIGNSPRSDILPALAAGLGAVFIPHHATWELELGEIPDDGNDRLIVLERFDHLTRYF